ncbi:T9SS type A sorting domain-containing protein, partial [Aequorivita viscosa]
NLVFVSTPTSNGELAEVPNTSLINGEVTVQRYMQNSRSYRMVSSAVTTTTSIHENWQEGATSNTDNPAPGFGTHITGTTADQTNGFDGTITGNSSMFTVNVPNQQFEAINNTNINTLNAGEAYLLFVRGDRSIDLTNPTDNLSSSTVLRTTGSLITGTNTQNFATSTEGDLVMFGNPYQSTVDINSVFAASTNVNTGYYYVYDPSLGAYGSYVTVILPSGSNTSGSTANQFLQPGQGAQVSTLAAGTSSIVLSESDKSPGEFTNSNRPFTSSDMLTVKLFTTENFNNRGSVHDSFGIVFAEGYNNGLTSDDAVKPMNFYENLGINNNGTYLSIEQRELPQSAEVYTLYSTGYTKSEYTLKLTVDGLENTSLYLDDRFTGLSTLLATGDTTYGFTVDANNPISIASDRFSIRTEQRLGVEDNDLLAGIRLFPNPFNGNTFYINAPKLNGEQLTVSINDLTGRNIYEKTLDCLENTITVKMGDNISSGVYLVTLNYDEEANTYRLINE